MEKIKNPKTGLWEEPNYFHGLPKVYQKSPNQLKFHTRLKAAHSVNLENGFSLDFLSRLQSSDTLAVVFHGAISETRLFYPRFERERSLSTLGATALHFADPTLHYSKDQSMRLGWYLGGPGFDPLLDISTTVRVAARQIGAKNIVFIGGSGGGFAALRISAYLPGSLAFVQDPQTAVYRYYPGAVGRYFKTVWPGINKTKIITSFPERFDVNHLYKHFNPENYVYYYQNATDEFHRKRHFNEFIFANGGSVGGKSFESKDRKLLLVNGTNPGHGKITPKEFTDHYHNAIGWWLNAKG